MSRFDFSRDNYSPWFVLAGVISAMAAVPAVAAQQAWRQFADPADAGWSIDKLEECRRFAEQVGSAAVFIVHRGHVLGAWGEIERRFDLHSVRKSLLSGLYGLYAGGTLDVQKTLAELGIDDVPPLTESEKQARVVDLLRSRSGVYHTAAKEPPDMKQGRPTRGSRKPGEHFWYNNWDFNTLGVVFERVTGKRVFEEFNERFAQPLGMEDFRVSDGLYELELCSSIHPAHAFNLSARDLARFGLLFLRNGEHEGRQILPPSWIKESTSIHSPTGNGEGYGYMWWAYPAGGFGFESNLDALNSFHKFAARGTGGQFLLVVPDADFVFVHRVDTDNGRSVRGRKVWELAELILDARTGSPKPEPALTTLKSVPLGPVLPPPKQRLEIPLDSEQVQEILGEWEQEGELKLQVNIHMHQGRLFGLAKDQGETELFTDAPNSYFSKTANLHIEVQHGPDGKVTHAQMSFQGRSSLLRKVK